MESNTGKVRHPCEADPLVLHVTLADDDDKQKAGYPGRFTTQVRILNYRSMPGQKVHTLFIILGFLMFVFSPAYLPTFLNFFLS